MIKRDIVLKDERESNLRAILNLGHTFGHAIEKLMDYGSWLHGEAVAVGICMACRLSRDEGLISEESYMRVESVIKKAQLPTRAPKECSPEKMVEIMRGDKKNSNGKINLVLLRGMGDAILSQNFSEGLLFKVIEEGKES